MTVLLKPDLIKVMVPSRTLDEHGWAETEALTEAGEVKGTIQELSPVFDATATGSGAGPASPMTFVRLRDTLMAQPRPEMCLRPGALLGGSNRCRSRKIQPGLGRLTAGKSS